MMEKIVKKESYWYYVLKSLRKQNVTLIGLGIVLLIISLAILAPIISPYKPNFQHWGEEYEPPSKQFLLGTDGLGRDVLSRIIWGARTSLVVGIYSTFISTVIAIILGSMAGYFGGRFDQLIMRFTDIIMTIPSLLFYIFIAAIIRKSSLILIISIIGLLRWPLIMRIIRSSFLSLKETTFIEAAQGLGASDMRIIFLHLLPNALSPLIVAVTLQIPNAIIIEATISFLALGDPTAISWGNMLNRGHEVMRSAWWIAIFPGLMIFFTVLGFNIFGDGLRDSLDVRLRER
jgi:peptide/nickel transport system permease protein